MKCIVKGCPEEAYTLLLFIGRFGARQPHMGVWTAMWLCKTHNDKFAKKLLEIGVEFEVLRIATCT